MTSSGVSVRRGSAYPSGSPSSNQCQSTYVFYPTSLCDFAPLTSHVCRSRQSCSPCSTPLRSSHRPYGYISAVTDAKVASLFRLTRKQPQGLPIPMMHSSQARSAQIGVNVLRTWTRKLAVFISVTVCHTRKAAWSQNDCSS